ncbi:peptidoglycan D,D-transpeptidase FtsI family protein [Thermovenabulum gondwanense]|uniref:Penicillin-binding protein A n=1 Tax=Thermovenabulum gondwanense TaxID=520767 RepID=A0A162MWC4_9FIRM|nr:penicillin-binding transpeptidase domain-containing protein [Thermovenabulum gondwanense]KYO68007.1 Penicillin-binding protein A [Thermovenabulum gondwanense]
MDIYETGGGDGIIKMNNLKKNIKTTFYIFCLLFLSLMSYLTYFQLYERQKLIESSYNRRLWEQETKIKRGTIYDRNGVTLAETIDLGTEKKRIYISGEAFGPLLGYSSMKIGRSGLESALNGELLGIAQKEPLSLLRQKIYGLSQGNDVYLTVDAELQKKAYSLLEGKRGAVVALEPETGAVLIMVSSPGFDSNKVEEQWEKLKGDRGLPLLNRALTGLYPPGSAFKVVTLSGVLENFTGIEKEKFETKGYIKVGGRVIKDDNSIKPGEYSLKEAFAVSSNAIFAGLGLRLGRDKLLKIAGDFGFNSKIPFEMYVKKSQFPGHSLMDSDVQLAEDSIGQGKVLTTPLLMASIAQIIANHGVYHSPYIIDKVKTPLGQVKVNNLRTVRKTVISPQTADIVRDYMVEVVEKGTGKAARMKDIKVAGKTGTAENPHGEPHSWFIGFAPAQDPAIAIAVIVENGGSGGKVAAPIAREIIEYYFKIRNRK